MSEITLQIQPVRTDLEVPNYTITGAFLRAAYLVVGNGIDGPGLLRRNEIMERPDLIPHGFLLMLIGQEGDIRRELDQEAAFGFFADTVRATVVGTPDDDKGWATAGRLVTGISAAYGLETVDPERLPLLMRPPSKIMVLKSADGERSADRPIVGGRLVDVEPVKGIEPS